jgi:hypothetical protein
MKGLGTDLLATAAQAGVFLAGLALSLVVGMVLAAVLDGPGGLLFATLLSGTGLLVGATLSQQLRDFIIQRDLDRHQKED